MSAERNTQLFCRAIENRMGKSNLNRYSTGPASRQAQSRAERPFLPFLVGGIDSIRIAIAADRGKGWPWISRTVPPSTALKESRDGASGGSTIPPATSTPAPILIYAGNDHVSMIFIFLQLIPSFGGRGSTRGESGWKELLASKVSFILLPDLGPIKRL